MLNLAALFAGLLTGLAVERRWRPLLFERWRGLAILPLVFLSSLTLWILNQYRPDWLWTEDRSLAISLQAFGYLLAVFFVLLNLWSLSNSAVEWPLRRWCQRISLIIIGAGLVAKAAVILLNHGQMPISTDYLAEIADPATAEAIRHQALYLKQLIQPGTRLPWLGQIWRCDWLSAVHLIPIPFISPAELILAAGLFLTGISQFWKWSDSLTQRPDDLPDVSHINKN